MKSPAISRRSRRRWLSRLATGLALWPLLPEGRAAPGLRPTPAQTEGPFYPVRPREDTDFDLLAQGPLRYAEGQPCWVQGSVTDTSGAALAGAVVEIWQCDGRGRYHHPGDGGRADPAFQGFGRVLTGADGRYRFHTIRPVPYTGRTPHIHFKVRLGERDVLTTQLYVEGDPGNVRDAIWRRLSAADRTAVTKPFEPGPDGLRCEFTLVVET